jgi:hypothetical protein
MAQGKRRRVRQAGSNDRATHVAQVDTVPEVGSRLDFFMHTCDDSGEGVVYVYASLLQALLTLLILSLDHNICPFGIVIRD